MAVALGVREGCECGVKEAEKACEAEWKGTSKEMKRKVENSSGVRMKEKLVCSREHSRGSFRWCSSQEGRSMAGKGTLHTAAKILSLSLLTLLERVLYSAFTAACSSHRAHLP